MEKIQDQILGYPQFVTNTSLHIRRAHCLQQKKLRYAGTLKFVWVREGSVFIRKDENSPAVKLHNEVQITELAASKRDPSQEEVREKNGTNKPKKHTVDIRSPNGNEIEDKEDITHHRDKLQKAEGGPKGNIQSTLWKYRVSEKSNEKQLFIIGETMSNANSINGKFSNEEKLKSSTKNFMAPI